MEIIQFITILGAIIGSFVYLVTELRSFEKEIRSDVSQQGIRTDKLHQTFMELTKQHNARTDELNARTDKLYENFIDLLKEVRR